MWEEGTRIYGTLGVPNNFPLKTLVSISLFHFWTVVTFFFSTFLYGYSPHLYMFDVGNIINFQSQRIIKRKRNQGIRIRKILFYFLRRTPLIKATADYPLKNNIISCAKWKIIRYSRSTINAYSLLSHEWWIPPWI